MKTTQNLESFKKPDLKAPRYRKKVHNPINKLLFASLRYQHECLREMSDDEMRAHLRYYLQMIRTEILQHPDGSELNNLLGIIFIGSTASPRKRYFGVDCVKSIALGKKVHHKNWETDGLTCNIFYTNFYQRFTFRFRELWRFEADKKLKKGGSDAFKEDHQRFVQVEPWMTISKMFNLYTKRQRFKAEVASQLRNLPDEFAL
jgi:hypothetical protein